MAKAKGSYKDVLEANAQRGDMTHQKEFALNIRQQREEQEANAAKEKVQTKKRQEGAAK